jgi:hypothetical protein
MLFVYLFLGSLHFTLWVYLFVKYCYHLGVLLRRYVKSKLYGNTLEPITIAISTNTRTVQRSTTQRISRTDASTSTSTSTSSNDTYDTDTETDSGDDSADTDTDDGYDSDDDIDITTREIAYEETEKVAGKYYIGIAYLDTPTGVYLMNGTISNRSFFAFAYNRIVAYTRRISVFYVRSNTKLDLLKLHIRPSGVYEVSIHTFWIRLIQRAWRKTYTRRKYMIRLRGNIRNQEYFRKTGKYMYGTNVLPSIHGILSNTSNPN